MYCVWNASDYRSNHRTCHINAAWVEIKQDGKVIYSRCADDTGTGQWFDESHRRIYEAARALEEAILNAPIERSGE